MSKVFHELVKNMNSLSLDEKQAIIKFLTWQALQDGELSSQEIEFLREVVRQMSLKDIPAFSGLRRVQDPKEILGHLTTKDGKLLLLRLTIQMSFADGVYDARERASLAATVSALGLPLYAVEEIEYTMAETLRSKLAKLAEESNAVNSLSAQPKEWNWLKILGTAVVGGGALALTGGLAAPAIGGLIGTSLLGLSGAAASSAGLAFLGGGALAAGGAGMAGGTALVSTALGACGAGVAGSKARHLLGNIEECDIQHIDGIGLHACLGISGFLQQGDHHADIWSPLADFFPKSANYTLIWESKKLHALGDIFSSLSSKGIASLAGANIAKSATKAAFQALAWPATLLSLMEIIDNPWSVAKNRADQAGQLLGDYLATGQLGIPVTLVGYSLGTRVIIAALNRLAELGISGKVYNVYFLAGAVSQNDPRLDALSSVVAGKIVNVYCTNDVVLSYIYRAAELFSKPIGVSPLDRIDVLNIDVTEYVSGHLDYLQKLHYILSEITDQTGINRPTKSSKSSNTNINASNAGEPSLRLITSIIKQVPGMTSADRSDFVKSSVYIKFSNGLAIHTWKNTIGVDHVFISNGNCCVYGGYVGWVHSSGLEVTLATICRDYQNNIVA